ncbi:tRNA-splicing ligase RtcB [Candidatus Bilamarchaeum dharawalense]|uniref:tRNA-splicing ligase RtcB n=1 Tax=Candidatus Bilamarchaeum dharawalense TaxID=2885759 RepID=A0A5E4LQU3_9ARCH|nr:tRNA-splicing ligase RtcB [Candidatus Bilamarchaeum dharawalense]
MKPNFKKITDYIWEIGTDYKQGMLVPARIYASENVLNQMDMHVYDQVTNVATLPGIVKYAYCMPDGHSGYGFPIGGVAAMDIANEGVISPGGIGFDINCGMRLIRTDLTIKDVQPKIKELLDKLFKSVPAGVGSRGFVKLDAPTFRKVVEEGSEWCVNQGYGWKEDLEVTELGGREENANNKTVSDRAVERGKDQIGTLGSGNHYLEIQHVKEENIMDKQLAKKWGIFPDQIVVMFHCGSRGFGHQVATDYLNLFLDVMESKYKIRILDRELACAPFNSPEGQNYFSAMKCAMNMSFANRQTILHRVREVFSEVFQTDAEKLGLHQIYDVAHNRASVEKHDVDGTMKELIVHRKGATAAFGPGRPEVTKKYGEDGQPVIIGGSMETGSYLLVGAETGAQTWFTTAHGSGRTMSRTEAKRRYRGDQLQKDMAQRGILVKTNSLAGLAEEAGAAYKNIDEVIESAHAAGISRKVVKLIPIANVKG